MNEETIQKEKISLKQRWTNFSSKFKIDLNQFWKWLGNYLAGLTEVFLIKPIVLLAEMLLAICNCNIKESNGGLEEMKPFINQEECDYKIYIPQKVWLKMAYFVKHCPVEVGGHLYITEKDKQLFVNAFIIPTQQVDGTSYTPSHRYLAKTRPDMLKHIKGWFHSHADMGAFWSSVDENTIKNSLDVFQTYCISIVMNKQREYKIRLDLKEDGKIKTFDNLPLNILLHTDHQFENECMIELKQKVKVSGWFDVLVPSFWKRQQDGI